MADDEFEAFRVWPGLEPADLDVPHRLLELTAGERDPLTIVRAADRRSAQVRNHVPADREAERDALLALVEAARDTMLAAIRVASDTTAVPQPPPVPAPASGPPPVPPVSPAPPPVPAAVEQEDGLSAADPGLEFTPRRVYRRRRSDGTSAALGRSAVLFTAVAVTTYIAWPHIGPALWPPIVPPTPVPSPTPKPDPKPDPAPVPRPVPKPVAPSVPDPEPEPEPAPEPEPMPKPDPDPQRSVEPADLERARSMTDEAVTKAFAAIKRRDFAAARRELESARQVAGEDSESADRLARWLHLTGYWDDYVGHRDKAIEALREGRDFDVGVDDVVSITFYPGSDTIGMFRDGQPGPRMKRDALPQDVEHLIMAAWFAPNQAANHIMLGVAALACSKPDLESVQREWKAAAAKGEDDGRYLLGILDDPVVGDR